jgi:hypothetical protein
LRLAGQPRASGLTQCARSPFGPWKTEENRWTARCSGKTPRSESTSAQVREANPGYSPAAFRIT